MKQKAGLTAGVLIFSAVLFGVMVDRIMAGQEDQITADYAKIKKAKNDKHTPLIEAPAKVQAGEWFEVTVTIGHKALHPTLKEHYINWIALYKGDVELARVYLHPVHTMPKVTFTIALEAGNHTLRVLEQPNHTAPWEATKKIKVTK